MQEAGHFVGRFFTTSLFRSKAGRVCSSGVVGWCPTHMRTRKPHGPATRKFKDRALDSLSFDGEVVKDSYFLAGGWFQTLGLAGWLVGPW